jgi:hypothetical protein
VKKVAVVLADRQPTDARVAIQVRIKVLQE